MGVVVRILQLRVRVAIGVFELRRDVRPDIVATGNAEDITSVEVEPRVRNQGRPAFNVQFGVVALRPGGAAEALHIPRATAEQALGGRAARRKRHAGRKRRRRNQKPLDLSHRNPLAEFTLARMMDLDPALVQSRPQIVPRLWPGNLTPGTR